MMAGFDRRMGFASIRETASKPEWTILTATSPAPVSDVAGAGGFQPIGAVVQLESIDIDFSRPHGKRFGTLVHAVLSRTRLDADHDGVSQIASLQGRILGSSEEEVVAAVKTVQGALNHPLVQKAAAAARSGKCRREEPVALKLDDGSIVEGIVDLAFQEEGSNGSWTVIDYKTDFEVKGRLSEYQNQVSLYARAIARATNRPAKGILLRI
jgi:ATP-dependent helicase/nuclease subunit A